MCKCRCVCVCEQIWPDIGQIEHTCPGIYQHWLGFAQMWSEFDPRRPDIGQIRLGLTNVGPQTLARTREIRAAREGGTKIILERPVGNVVHRRYVIAAVSVSVFGASPAIASQLRIRMRSCAGAARLEERAGEKTHRGLSARPPRSVACALRVPSHTEASIEATGRSRPLGPIDCARSG